MTLISRYIAGRVLRGILLAFVIVTAIITLVDFVEATRNIGDEGGFNLLQLAGLTLLKVPQLIEETIPFVVLFGVMGALYGLNKRSELVVLRASGLSAWQFLWPAIMVSLIIGLIWALVFNPLAARSMAKYQSVLMMAAHSTPTSSNIQLPKNERFEEVWLREGTQGSQTVIHGKAYASEPLTLREPTFYFYTVSPGLTGETEYSHRIDAEQTTLSQSGYWQLRGIIRNNKGNQYERAITMTLPTRIGPDDLRSQSQTSRKTQFWALPAGINAAADAGFSTVGLRLQLHKLLSLPLMLIALTIVAAGVSMGNVRSGGVIRLMLAGAAMGFFVYFFNNLISAFGEAQTLSIPIAVWTVPCLVLLLGLAYLARLEDG